MEDYNKALELLKKVERMLNKSTDVHAVNSVYMTPAQRLRDQALEIEAHDRFIDELRQFLRDK